MFLLLYKRKTENMPRLIETSLGYFENKSAKWAQFNSVAKESE